MTFRKCYEIFIFYFYGRRQGNACEIQFRGLLYAREVLISRTVAQNFFLRFQMKKNLALDFSIEAKRLKWVVFSCVCCLGFWRVVSTRR
jgi:hypothetical protein